MDSKYGFLLMGLVVGVSVTVLSQFFLIPSAISREGPTHLSIGTLGTTSGIPIYIALDRGYFESEGLDISITKFDSSNDLVKSLVNKEVDFAGPLSTLTALDIEQKSPQTVKIISDSRMSAEKPFTSIIVASNSDIKDVKELNGKRLALFPGSTALALTRIAFQDLVPGDFQLRYTQMPPEFWLKAIASGQADAVVSYEPVTTQGLVDGSVRILYNGLWEKNVGDNLPLGSSLVSAEYAQKNPENVKRIQRAMRKAIEFTKSNEPETRKISEKYLSVTEPVAMRMNLPNWEVGNDIDVESLQVYADLLYNQGELYQKVDVSRVIQRE